MRPQFFASAGRILFIGALVCLLVLVAGVLIVPRFDFRTNLGFASQFAAGPTSAIIALAGLVLLFCPGAPGKTGLLHIATWLSIFLSIASWFFVPVNCA